MSTEWVILGCGYIGTRVARALLAEGCTVRACARRVEKLAPLGELGARVQALDAGKSRQFGPALYGARNPVVVYAIPPVPNMPAGEPVRRAAEAALGVGAQRFIYLSSTAVYGINTDDSETVDEDTAVAISDAEAIPRVADEFAVESARLSGLPTVVLRLSAVYGPGRGVRERLRAGTYKLIDEGAHWYSRVHVDDVVGIIRAAADRAPNPALYTVSDDRPTTQREYADWLVARLGVGRPPSVASLAPGAPRRPVRNRRVSNARLKRELDYRFRYPSYLEGEPAIEAEAGGAAVEKPAPPVEKPAAPVEKPAEVPTATRQPLSAELITLPPGARLPLPAESHLYVVEGSPSLDGARLAAGDTRLVRAEATLANDGDAPARVLRAALR
jgi:nucleoside-diphosphate-sugar epimerase